MDALGKQVYSRFEALNSIRNIQVSVWQKCFDYTYPMRGEGFYNEISDASNNLRKKARITDSTATDSVRILASAIMDGMTPANARWFELDVGSESDEENRWLQNAADIIWKNIHNANFDAQAFESIIDLIIAGWFVMFIDEDPEGGFQFTMWPITECCIASSVAGGAIDTVFREFEYTAEQAVSEYGLDNLSEEIQKAVQQGKEQTKFRFIHAVYPRKTYLVDSKLAKNMPIASVHVEKKSKKTVRESGFPENPCIAPRWHRIPSTAYAVGPVYEALPDVATINEIKTMELANLDIAIAGMWIAEDDGVLNARAVKVGARKVIVANSVDSMKRLDSGSDFQVAFMAEDRIQAQIRKVLLADQLQPQDGPAMTATEVHIRMQLVRQMLGPVYGRFQSEYLQPLIDRCFGIAFRAGVLGRPPESLLNRNYQVKYVSPLARAQRMEEVNAIDAWVMGAAEKADFAPQVLDIIDFDEAERHKAEALGVPAKVIRSPEDVVEIRQAREADAQQDKTDALAENFGMEAGKQLAGNLANG